MEEDSLILGSVNFPFGRLNSFYELSLGGWKCRSPPDTPRGHSVESSVPRSGKGINQIESLEVSSNPCFVVRSP